MNVKPEYPRMKFLAATAICGLLLSAGALAAPADTGAKPLKIEVFREVKRDTSAPLRDLLASMPAPVAAAAGAPPTQVYNFLPGIEDLIGRVPRADNPSLQLQPSGNIAPAPLVSFNALASSQAGGFIPPDTMGDVSPAHYFQWVNTRWALYNKVTGALMTGPNAGSSFFAGFGGLCQTTNQGDPLVLWDDAAQRWIVSQFAFTSSNASPWFQCIAVSTTSDPLGSYHRYAFQYPAFNDYGKMGIWRSADGSQNAYLFTQHEFLSGAFQGASFAAVDRTRMLDGLSSQFIRVSGGTLASGFGALPFHLEGVNPMPAGACPIFVHHATAGNGYRMWDMCLNWTAGTATLNGPTLVGTQNYSLGIGGTDGIPQAGTATRLDSFTSNLMYIAAMRAFPSTGPSEAYGAISHVVDAGSSRGALRWVQFAFKGPAPAQGSQDLFKDGFEDVVIVPAAPNAMAKRVLHEGSYAPGTVTRWMSSINIDQNGNLGVGYTASGPANNPEIRITGRERNDAAGLLLDEQVCTPPNTGAQTGGVFAPRTTGRWGDYSMTSIDPVDDCTFWHTNEYFPTTSAASWQTRVCSFKFPGCGQADFLLERTPQTTLAACTTAASDPTVDIRAGVFGNFSGTVTLSASGFPAGVTPSFSVNPINAGQSSTSTLVGARLLPPGNYSGTVNGVNGAINRSVAVNFGVSAAVAPAPVLTAPANGATGASIRPTLTWAAALGATEYRVELANNPGFSPILDSATVTGTSYVPAVLLTVGTQYYWRVRASNFCGTGGLSTTSSFTTGTPGVCPSGTVAAPVFQDDVSGDLIPWTTENTAGAAASLWQKVVPTAGTGITTRAWYATNGAVTTDQRLTSPAITLPAGTQRPLTLAFDAFHRYEVDGATDCWDGGFVEISTDGGSNWNALGNLRTLTDSYPGVLSSGNPGVGNSAWCRQPAGGASVRTIFTLDDFAGQSVRLRFRSTADSNTVGATPNGWAIDNIQVQGCQ